VGLIRILHMSSTPKPWQSPPPSVGRDEAPARGTSGKATPWGDCELLWWTEFVESQHGAMPAVG